MNKMIFSKKILTLSLIVIVFGVLIYFIFIKKASDTIEGKSSEDIAEQIKKPEETPLPVKVAVAKRGDLVIKLKSPGKAVTNRMITVKAEVAGVIKKLNVEEGQRVKEGDLLVELDDKRYKLELERYQADRLSKLSEMLLERQFEEAEKSAVMAESERLQRAKEKYEEARQLYLKGVVSEEQFEKAYKEYEIALVESGEKKEEVRSASKGLTQAEIAVKTARLNLEKTKIRAPFSGIICNIQVSPQEHVTGNMDLFTLVNISRIQIQAKVLESEIRRMRIGREVDLRFSAYPEKVFKGKVRAIVPIVDPEDKTCTVVIDVPNPEEQIMPGMHAEVEIAAEIHKNKLLIPQEAILVRSGRKLAFVVENGLAKWRYIQVGLEDEEFAEVLESDRQGEGIKEGEKVIIEGHFTLAHDVRVRIIK